MDSTGETPELKLSFDPMTIEHLGFRMYSRLPNAVAELVANAFDADAKVVSVSVDQAGNQSVRVRDDGHGMSPLDLADKYLRIGRNRRLESGNGFSESGARRVAGRKGLGKLALFGIGKRITIRTKRAGAQFWTKVMMDWDDLLRSSGGDYFPPSSLERAEDASEHGTEILVEELARKSRVVIKDLAVSLSRLFNYVDSSFRLTVASVDGESTEVTRELRYASLDEEHRWDVPAAVPGAGDAPGPVGGVVIASSKPLSQDLRGVTVYVNGRLANDPEFFGASESSYAFSYLTGYVEANYLDELSEDVVATDRRSINWDGDDAAALREYLASVVREVATLRRETRKRAKEAALKVDLKVDPAKWVSTIENREVARSVEAVLEVAVSADTEISERDRIALVEGLRGVAPEYADFHWRTLHPSVQDAARDLYVGGHYYHALLEAIKSYCDHVVATSKVPAREFNGLQAAFGGTPPVLDVASAFLPDLVSDLTATGMRTAQRVLSEGLWSGFRNPIAHQGVAELNSNEVFSYQDCLDALSILSHLWRRVDGAVVPTGSES